MWIARRATEEKMKKIISILSVILLMSLLSAAEYPLIKIAEFENRNEIGFLFIRPQKELNPMEDATGSGVIIDSLGNYYIGQTENKLLYTLELKDFSLSKYMDLSILEWASEGIEKITENYIFCTGFLGRFKLLDKNFNPIFRIKLLDWGKRIETREAYYDEKSNILFFRDDEGQIYSIVNPGLNDEENKKNFLEPEQTIEMINSEKYFTKEHISLYKEKYLNVDGKIIWWVRDSIGNYTYQNIDNKKVKLWNGDSFYIDCTSPEEQVESISFHPSGDIYVLRINWNTNTHNLYSVENAWDPEWRKQWYEKK